MMGTLNLLKPPGMTSHDAVEWMRCLSGERRVGHAGTLDPDACGVLVLLLGKATRAAQFLLAAEKEYRAEAIFGLETDTLDRSGKVRACRDASYLTPEAVNALLPQFTGVIWQRPPLFSAIKQQGRRLYQLARAGEEVEVLPRQVEVSELRLLRGEWGIKHPRVQLLVRCGKGTYVRSLIDDLGRVLGTGACLSFLLRTRVGRFQVREAYTLEELAHCQREGRMAEALTPVGAALEHLPALEVGEAEAAKIRHGTPLTLDRFPATEHLAQGSWVRVVHAEELLAVAEVTRRTHQPEMLRPRWVL
ncbi:tRNA pseudouridine(55) synthase TruB [Desulfothermobacter acidiphilus]|uniref:tRNA pseudouridine(55) synthase TruB n=1 Tax=Desulfothermobacter acidiphilus TaxID=1938353 RepID=UPI003F8A5EE8